MFFCVCVWCICIHIVYILSRNGIGWWRDCSNSEECWQAHPSWTGLSCMSGWERGLSTRMKIVWFTLFVSSLCYICVTEQFFLVTWAIVDLCGALILSFEIFCRCFLPFLGSFYDPVLVFVEYSTLVDGTSCSAGQMHACGLVGESARGGNPLSQGDFKKILLNLLRLDAIWDFEIMNIMLLQPSNWHQINQHIPFTVEYSIGNEILREKLVWCVTTRKNTGEFSDFCLIQQ